MSNPISNGIKRLRAQHKLTQAELAEMAQIPRATIANMESDNSNPSISLVVKIARALGVTVDDLILTKQSANVTLVARKDMPTTGLEDGLFTSVRTSPISTPNLQMNDIKLKVGCSCKGVPHPQGSNELFLCISGEACLKIAGEEFIVSAGNLIYFHGHLPHYYINNGDTEVRAIAVVYMS